MAATFAEYSRIIKSCIGEIMISIHRQSKDEEVLSQLRIINSTIFLMTCGLHNHVKEHYALEKLKTDLETFWWDMLFIDKTKEEPFLDVIKGFKENISDMKHRMELMNKFMQLKNTDEVFFGNLIKAHIEGKI